MPLFEMIFNAVSPLRLIELSQPGSPLLSRLFTEAPGTSQHCVMVANLAEAGAEAIGANPLVVRVGAYYHDIGKLENPEMFTENQSGHNPHDDLEPEVSAGIILAHPESGLRLARKYRLPTVVCKMIYEHHGNSKQIYFLRKAQERNEKNHLEAPDHNRFRYRTARPSFKESAILMLADTVEAAMKSTGITDLNKAEELIRRLVKIKIEEDQLNDSDLSFKEVEKLIQAFLHVYSGHFKIRVRYPDDSAHKE
jgi:cyclic-di-AMP phosphodiesterase PgpH